jgi:peroxiredoxin 2/4
MSVLVGQKAPTFSAKAVVNGHEIVETFSLDDYIGKKYILLLFYPKDFTFVCPTELIAFQKALPEFEKRDVQVIGISTDSEHTHWAWLNTPKNQGGIQGVTYPLVADINKTISDDYDVLEGQWTEGEDGEMELTGELVAYRGLFLIDKNGVIQHQVINNEPIGRSTKEALRTIDAWQHFEEHGEVCPANWQKGDDAMQENHKGVAAYLSNH